MDKLGIFKLLNSFFDFYKNSSNGTSTPFSNLFGQNSNQNNSSPPSKQENKANGKGQAVPLAPIQNQMLYTLQNHDLFVKRVIEKNNR